MSVRTHERVLKAAYGGATLRVWLDGDCSTAKLSAREVEKLVDDALHAALRTKFNVTARQMTTAVADGVAGVTRVEATWITGEGDVAHSPAEPEVIRVGRA